MTVELIDTRTERLGRAQEFAALHRQAEQFYARQMRILDTHDVAAWGGLFTEDATLDLPFLPEPVPARTGLTRYPRAGAARRRRAGHRLTHWVGRLDLLPGHDHALRTRCSALVHAPSDESESQALHMGGGKSLYVCVMEDALVPSRGEWRIAHRRVLRDDLA
ncbi:SnoaL-like domain-containing protein [Streptomyces sp. YC504]|uniref:SnoaL-like domain-containing protein n=1 Tax=Streptomyces mesophilus TaxID=1775132 RepID=A0A6G4XA81_9ACTN|nr:nuclear transport factor 2 family protein [Streptomyces mesophilus]NGO74456.1 SnoaL-like domain-containing protein [Streptomyces mesophilus]